MSACPPRPAAVLASGRRRRRRPSGPPRPLTKPTRHLCVARIWRRLILATDGREPPSATPTSIGHSPRNGCTTRTMKIHALAVGGRPGFALASGDGCLSGISPCLVSIPASHAAPRRQLTAMIGLRGSLRRRPAIRGCRRRRRRSTRHGRSRQSDTPGVIRTKPGQLGCAGAVLFLISVL